MARLARIVAPGCPHHVTARGNRREPIFFEDGDQDLYLDILAEHMAEAQVAVWAYCLMPNHVHLIACPETAEGLGRAMGAAHRRWANARGRWRGHLFDGRFASVAMDEDHLLSCVRYVALNPVRAGLAASAWDWRWSSVHAHGRGQDDGVVRVAPVLERAGDIAAFLAQDEPVSAWSALRASERTGRPLGTDAFVADLERRLGRPIARRAPGRKGRTVVADQMSLL